MFTQTNKELYINLINGLKELNHEKKALVASKEYRMGLSICEKTQKVRDGGVAQIFDIVRAHAKFKKGEKYSMATAVAADRDYGVSNYFLDERVAVYTCITGGYDSVIDPLFVPDNCDFYALTDFPISAKSKWKRIDVSQVQIPDSARLQIKDSSVLLNRYFKMNPQLLFPDYKYSVYVDGNIRICTDMTEYVNRISSIGISTFKHSQRNCIYEEAEACVAMGKETREKVNEHINHLREAGMPRNYGMAQCSIIVREHNKINCVKLMDEWWFEFTRHAKRDQLSFPFVMYKNKIPMDQITTLGFDVYAEDSFEIIKHGGYSNA